MIHDSGPKDSPFTALVEEERAREVCTRPAAASSKKPINIKFHSLLMKITCIVNSQIRFLNEHILNLLLDTLLY